ncbi:MAG: argininosuccinate lyase [Coriobacteriia bacterium]|nr:argininosuccinate lyase [Coriobacteriia bacterium]MCL2537683.1 argininosuccinate lyase [Coriobacteriia bacterium]
MSLKKPAWSGRFSDVPSEDLIVFGASLPVDKRMWRQDIAGSIVHSQMLARQGIITDKEAAAIKSGLQVIEAQIEEGSFQWAIEDEDVHMAIEQALTKLIGEDGARLHTGRSRNDQVATDTRLYLMDRVLSISRSLNALRLELIHLAEKHSAVIIPGYTHLQKAQPISIAHYYLAYAQMFARDFKRFTSAYEAADNCPLGSAALAGTSYPLDREYVADQLGFTRVSINALDSVSDRDFLLDAVYAASVCQVHLSRLSEELILWTTEEFGYLKLSDKYSTGSSIMPQKKNADFAELIRGKTGRVVGDLNSLLVTLKGLPLAYNKDMQEDKEPAFDALDTIESCIKVMTGMIAGLSLNEGRMREASTGGFMAATDLADYLVEKHLLPFRQAHEIVGNIVLTCERQGRKLQDLSIDELQGFYPGFGRDVEDALRIDKIVDARTTEGGTSRTAIAVQLEKTRQAYSLDEQLIALR